MKTKYLFNRPIMLFTMSLFKGMKPPKNMDRWKGMESWLRIHYFDHLDTSSKNQEEENNQKEEEHSSLLHARFVVCILNGAGATPVGLEADLEVRLSSYYVDITIVLKFSKIYIMLTNSYAA